MYAYPKGTGSTRRGNERCGRHSQKAREHVVGINLRALGRTVPVGPPSAAWSRPEFDLTRERVAMPTAARRLRSLSQKASVSPPPDVGLRRNVLQRRLGLSMRGQRARCRRKSPLTEKSAFCAFLHGGERRLGVCSLMASGAAGVLSVRPSCALSLFLCALSCTNLQVIPCKVHRSSRRLRHDKTG